MTSKLPLAALLMTYAALAPIARGDLIDPSKIITLNNNGSWCWFQDERVLALKGKLIISSVASQGGPGGTARNGNIEITTYDPAAAGQKSTISVLHEKLQEDDHDAAGLMQLPDGRFLAMFSKHLSDKIIHYRISANPNDATSWDPEKTIARDANVTYNNLFRLSAENNGKGKIYDFYRGEHYKPNFLTSDDNGKTWTYGTNVVHIAADPQDKMRPYARYASNNLDTIWIANTDAHPAEYPATSLYLMYLKAGNLCKADGTLIAPVSTGVEPAQETLIFKGDPKNQAWVCQMQLDKAGKPCIAYSIHKSDDGGGDLRYRYYDGATGLDAEFAYAGNFLYKTQEHYTGNVAVDPLDPHIMYFSTNADPKTGEPLISKTDNKRHWELYKCIVKPLAGAPDNPPLTFTITPLTANSSADNLRPIIPTGDHSSNLLLWLRGTYTSYTRWNMAIVAAPRE
jgi:hypothetical protein